MKFVIPKYQQHHMGLNMFLKKNSFRVFVFNGYGACRLMSCFRSSEIKYSIERHRPILQFNDIPTAKRLPLIGTKFNILLSGFGKRFHEYIDNRHKTLGPIFREPMGQAEIVFVSSPDLMRETFLHEGKYPKHPLPDAWILYNKIHNCKRGLFFMDDEEWLTNRKLMNSMLLRNDFKLIQNVVERESDNLILEWESLISNENKDSYTSVTRLMASLYTWSIKVLVGIMIGDKHTIDTVELNSLLKEFSAIVQAIFERTAPLMTIPPTFARKYNLRIWNEFEESVTSTLELADSIINTVLKIKGNGIMCEMQSKGMSLEMITRIFIDLIIAAGDTTAYSTQWALFLLSTNEPIQTKIREQLNWNDFETPLIRGTVRETLRLFPVATFIGRILPMDGIIGNFKIPQYTPVIASMYTIGRDAKSFPNPNTFQPNRWIRDERGHLQFVHRPNAYMPYAIGARSCIGQKLANSMMHIVLSKILDRFSLKLMNTNAIEVVMKLIAVPSEPLELGIKRLR